MKRRKSKESLGTLYSALDKAEFYDLDSKFDSNTNNDIFE